MAHFAELDDNNVVLRVLVVPDEQENRGSEYLHFDIGLGGRWLQCSYNGRIRGRFPGPGSVYDPELDEFDPIKEEPDGSNAAGTSGAAQAGS